jgi:cytoskeletal protein CcmA (bactofilin family)
LVLPTVALAAEIKTGDILTLSKQEKNVYAFGSEVKTESDTKGDLVVFSQNSDIRNEVENSLTAAGASVKVSGKIGNSTRIFSGEADVDGPVGADLIIFGGTIRITDKATIGGDVIIYGGTISLDGKTLGKVKLNGGQVSINGQVGSDAEIRSDSISVGDKAVIGGRMTYWSSQDAKVSSTARIKGGIEKNEIKETSKGGILALANAAGWSGFLLTLAGLFILALILAYFRPSFVEEAMALANKTPLTPLWKGVVGLIVAPVLVILLLITMVGALTAGALAVGYGLTLIISYALSVIITGSLITRLANKEYIKQPVWLTVLIGTIVYTVVGWIPFIGPLAQLVVFVIAFGTIVETVLKIEIKHGTKK